ncbi:MAG: CoA pyrophosphatase [Candidatus Protistobacter heckmanni]|nr:CoA pyrophosphatase [Candidatus Protistobacter heckmanni]
MSSRPRILDPQAIPVESVDTHLPPLPLERLRPEFVRKRLAWWSAAASQGGHLPGDESWSPSAAPEQSRPAAVLVPLVARPEQVTVLLTMRTAHLHDHAGQISFPGGRQEESDASPVATALRETEEEIGLQASHIDILGSLPEYFTGTGYRVTPVVGWVTPPFALKPDSFEVAEIFEVPLQFLMTPANHQRRRFDWQGGSRRFYAMPWSAGAVPDAPSYFIWGATAGMLRNLYHLLSEP